MLIYYMFSLLDGGLIKTDESLFCYVKGYSLLDLFLGDFHPADGSVGCNLINGYIMARAYFLHLLVIVIDEPHKITGTGFKLVDKSYFVFVVFSYLN